MALRIALIEDEDREQLPADIKALGDVYVSVHPPPHSLDLSGILETHVDLFLIDYELDTVQPDGSIANYLGMTLAARLREKRPEYPIVLLTRPDLPAWSSAQRTARFGGSFDSILYKEGIKDHPDKTYNKLSSLADGYKVIRKCEQRSVDSLLEMLKTDELGQENALQAIPPDDDWVAVEAATWIRSVLLRYPGVLYGSRHAATALGISINSFEEPSVLELLKDAEYQGPFATEKPRWWRHGLFTIAYQLSEGRVRELGFREGFRVAAAERLGVDLQASQDPQTGASPADTVCYVSGIPIRIETSLPYKPDTRPSVMDEARVSFRAIRETNCVDENHLDSQSRALLEEIRRKPDGD